MQPSGLDGPDGHLAETGFVLCILEMSRVSGAVGGWGESG